MAARLQQRLAVTAGSVAAGSIGGTGGKGAAWEMVAAMGGSEGEGGGIGGGGVDRGSENGSAGGGGVFAVAGVGVGSAGGRGGVAGSAGRSREDRGGSNAVEEKKVRGERASEGAVSH